VGQRHPGRLVDRLGTVARGGRPGDPVDDAQGAVEIGLVGPLDAQRFGSDGARSTDGACSTGGAGSTDVAGSTEEARSAVSLAGSTNR
jgi:hypothetical protein